MINPLGPHIWQALHADRPILTRQQERRFLDAAQDAPADTRALCELLFFTGCRVSEALALRRDHLDSDLLFVVFRTLKQRRAGQLRAVPVPSHLMRQLLGLPSAADGRLWPYSRWTAWRRLKDVMRIVGITGTAANTTAFRHGFNARGIRAGTPDRVRRAFLGHETLKANHHYGRLVGYELRSFAESIWSIDVPIHKEKP